MKMFRWVVLLLATLSFSPSSFFVLGFSPDLPTRTMGIRMPNVKPENDETYVCHPVKIDS